MPKLVDIDDIMYGLYVIDKIRKTKEAAGNGEILSHDDVKKEIEKWQ
jgi:hypothetical protein